MNFADERIVKKFYKMYGNEKKNLMEQKVRYQKLEKEFLQRFDDSDKYYVSSPGRTEIGGNHTDHNNGKVLAAAINLDSIAAASPNNKNEIYLYSDGYLDPFKIKIDNLDKIESENGSTNSLLRGIAARFIQLGYKIGGFNAVMMSDVLPGSGLSSSASVEVLIGGILNILFNNGVIENEELAKIGQWAENNYFGKPCGLMDQMACSVGGIIGIDFKNPKEPLIEKIDFNFESLGYKMLILDSGDNHEDLTEDYAAIPYEMKSVAKLFNKNVCREINYNEFIQRLPEIRKTVGDRAALRAFHFIEENTRVLNQIKFLRENNFSKFLDSVKESGNSSFKWLQNIYSIKNVNEQSLSISLALTEKFIEEKGEGVCRVHGGGFGGTIQVYLPNSFVDDYQNYVLSAIGNVKLLTLNIRTQGIDYFHDNSNGNNDE